MGIPARRSPHVGWAFLPVPSTKSSQHGVGVFVLGQECPSYIFYLRTVLRRGVWLGEPLNWPVVDRGLLSSVSAVSSPWLSDPYTLNVHLLVTTHLCTTSRRRQGRRAARDRKRSRLTTFFGL